VSTVNVPFARLKIVPLISAMVASHPLVVGRESALPVVLPGNFGCSTVAACHPQ
jgi:hypothetical protein